jgi:hypothetical protein
MLWKTITGKAATATGKSRNCEACRSFKLPAGGNFAANLSFVDLKISNSAQIGQKLLLPQGREQGLQGFSRQAFEQILVTGRCMTTGVSLAAN